MTMTSPFLNEIDATLERGRAEQDERSRRVDQRIEVYRQHAAEVESRAEPAEHAAESAVEAVQRDKEAAGDGEWLTPPARRMKKPRSRKDWRPCWDPSCSHPAGQWVYYDPVRGAIAADESLHVKGCRACSAGDIEWNADETKYRDLRAPLKRPKNPNRKRRARSDEAKRKRNERIHQLRQEMPELPVSKFVEGLAGWLKITERHAWDVWKGYKQALLEGETFDPPGASREASDRQGASASSGEARGVAEGEQPQSSPKEATELISPGTAFPDTQIQQVEQFSQSYTGGDKRSKSPHATLSATGEEGPIPALATTGGAK